MNKEEERLQQRVLSIKSPEIMVNLNPNFFWHDPLGDQRRITVEEFIHIFKLFNAFWQYKGEPNSERPHVKLTSGKCSNGFINCGKVLIYPHLRSIFSQQLVWLLREQCDEVIDWVISSDHAGASLVFGVSDALQVPGEFCEKGEGGKTQIWKRHQLPAGTKIFQVEELTTTVGTMEKVRAGIRAGNNEEVEFVPSGVLVNRTSPNISEFDGQPIISLITLDISNYEPDECSYCQAGSEAVRPKGDAWQELMATGR